ncbi:MAG TPA: hypothetical protein VJN21_04215 [Candidatus Acidoferrales bacterium]|nr:hypothetical protein [Candidatus Acidoferrales bacterium]
MRKAVPYLRPLVYAGLILVGFLVMGAGKLLYSPRNHPRSSLPQRKIIVGVLPIANEPSDPSDRALAEAVTREVITALQRTNEFRVITIGAPGPIQPNSSSEEEIVRQYHPDAFVAGTVSRSADRVQVAVELTDVSTRRKISSDQFSRSSRAVGSLPAIFAGLVADSVRSSLLPHAPAQ